MTLAGHDEIIIEPLDKGGKTKEAAANDEKPRA